MPQIDPNNPDAVVLDSGTTTPAPPAPVTPPVKPEDTAEYWRNQFNGKNGTAIKLQGKYAETLAEKEALAEKLSAYEVEAASKILTYEQQLKTLAEERDAAKASANAAEKVSGVRSTLGKPEFSAVKDLYDEDDIKLFSAKYSPEELTALLTKQAAAVGKLTGKKIDDFKAGSLPEQPSGQNRQSATVDVATAAADLEKATTKYGFRSPEYETARQAHLAAVMASSSP